MKVRDLVDRFERFAPKDISMDGDPIGLQIGSLDANVSKVMTTLDVRPDVVDEAVDNNVDFIFAHHPVMFRPAKNLDLSVPQNKMYAKIIENHITVYAAHTNLDSADGGMNDWLAEAVGLNNVEGLVPAPKNHFTGRIGDLSQPMSVKEFAERCKDIFNIGGLRLISHQPDKEVKRVALLGGDGGKFFNTAIAKGADVYITGDVYYHVGHDMISAGLSVVDPGHHIEAICIPKLAELFERWNQENDWNVQIIQSKVNTDPFTFM